MTTPLNGAIGGLFAALLSAVVVRLLRMVARHGAAGLSMQRVRVRRVWELILLLYGLLAGATLVSLDSRIFGGLLVPPTTVEAIGVALAWSAVLGLVLAAVGPYIWGTRVRQIRRIDILGFHLMYGLTLGIWIHLTWIT